MQIKRLILMSFLLMISIAFYGCNTKKSMTSDAKDFFGNLKQYEADVTITFLKDEQPNTLRMKQIAKMDGTYEMTVIEPEHMKGISFTCDGNKVTEYYPSIDKSVDQKVSTVQNEILLTNFAKRFLTNENIKKQEVQQGGKKMITYEIPIEGNFRYLCKEKIWLEEKKLTPMQLVLYDEKDHITIEVIYNEFKYNF